MTVFSAVYNEEFTNLDRAWYERWTSREIPPDGVELSRDHIQLYEGMRHDDPAQPREELPDVDDNESVDSDIDLGDVLDAADGEAVRGAIEPEDEPPVQIGLIQGQGNILPDTPFDQAVAGRGYLSRAVGQSPGSLVLILVRDMLVHVVACIGSHIAQEGLPIEPVGLGELLIWHALRIYMCMQKLPSVDMYWKQGSSGALTYPNFGKYMTFRRFRDIRRSFRFENYADGHDEEDAAWKIRSITNLMKNSFKRMMPTPRRNISVDEGMVRFTGMRCPIKRFMPDKPIQRGLKFFAGVDYESGFLFDFNWDDNRRTAANCRGLEWGMTGQCVLDLIEPLPGRGHHIFTDNYYTSIPLAKELLLRGHHLVGTIRRDRGVPEWLLLPSKKPTRACPKGTVQYAHTRDHQIHLYGWMDNGATYLLDAAFGPQQQQLTRREGARRVQYMLPKACSAYNAFMGGVDKYDQIRTGYYGIEMHGRTSKWTVRAYEALFNMGLANAFAAFRYLNKGLPSATDHANFLLRVAEELLNNIYVQEQRNLRRVPLRIADDELIATHALQRYEVGTGGAPNKRKRMCCVECPNKVDGRRDYSRRTTFFCVSCNVALHPECADAYHRKKLHR